MTLKLTTRSFVSSYNNFASTRLLLDYSATLTGMLESVDLVRSDLQEMRNVSLFESIFNDAVTAAANSTWIALNFQGSISHQKGIAARPMLVLPQLL